MISLLVKNLSIIRRKYVQDQTLITNISYKVKMAIEFSERKAAVRSDDFLLKLRLTATLSGGNR